MFIKYKPCRVEESYEKLDKLQGTVKHDQVTTLIHGIFEWYTIFVKVTFL
jgi:hypothetical protein